MRYGMNLFLWSDDVRGEAFLPLIGRLRDLGYDGVEVPIFAPDVGAYARLGRHLDGMGLARTAVTIRRPEHDPTSADPSVRRAGLAQMRGILESCAALGAPVLGGPLYASIGHFTGWAPTPDDGARAIDSVCAMAEVAADAGVTLALEPLNRFEIALINTAADGARFVRDVAHPRCRLMYDTFHAHIEETSVEQAIVGCADVLVHLHVSECHRGTPGDGQVNWRDTFAALRAIGYDGWLTVEAFGTALPHLAAATRVWRKTFASEEQLARDALRFMRGGWEDAASPA